MVCSFLIVVDQFIGKNDLFKGVLKAGAVSKVVLKAFLKAFFRGSYPFKNAFFGEIYRKDMDKGGLESLKNDRNPFKKTLKIIGNPFKKNLKKDRNPF